MKGMILYHGEPTGASLAVLAALGESGLDIECRRIDLLAGERHVLAGIDEPLARDMSVEGEGPVLVVTDAAGRAEAMTESVFIAQFLDECGAGSLQPADAYAHWQTLMWCRRITERCAPAAAFLGNRAYATPRLAAMDEAAFEATIAPIVSEDLQQRWRDTRAGAFPAELGADSRAKVTQAAEQVEAQLADGREWLMGPLTIADFETYGWLAGMAGLLADAFAGKPRLAAWLQRVRQRPSVEAALARAGVAAPEQSWAPGPEINRWG